VKRRRVELGTNEQLPLDLRPAVVAGTQRKAGRQRCAAALAGHDEAVGMGAELAGVVGGPLHRLDGVLPDGRLRREHDRSGAQPMLAAGAPGGGQQDDKWDSGGGWLVPLDAGTHRPGRAPATRDRQLATSCPPCCVSSGKAECAWP